MKRTEESKRRLMYVEKKEGDIDGAAGRIGWVTLSPDERKAYYRGRTLTSVPGEQSRGRYYDEGTGHEYWLARVKKTGTHAHFAARGAVRVDPDARDEYRRVRTPAD
jgi:hypothetical protein